MKDMDRFEIARNFVLSKKPIISKNQIYGEKTLHSVLKHYIESEMTNHEKKIGSFVVDVFSDNHIFEIQTRQFNKLRSKLENLLPEYPITIVYPMPARKWLFWIDPENGKISKPRLSPKQGNLHEVFIELYRIKQFLPHPNLSLMILLVDMEEYRLLNGWNHNRKRGSWRNERIPLVLSQKIIVNGPEKYDLLLPENLPPRFTSFDYAKIAKINQRLAQISLHVLNYLKVITTCGKNGRFILYTRS